MGAQKSGFAGELGSDLEYPELVGNGQSVATFDLDGGGTETVQLMDPRRKQPGQLVVSCGARSGNCDADAAAVVRLASHPRRKLRCSVASKDQVAVRIDKARDDHSPSNVNPSVGSGSVGGSGSVACVDGPHIT